MKSKCCFNLLIVILFFVVSCSENENSFYVSPMGNDNNPGTAKKPLLSLQKVLDELPENTSGNFTISLLDGIYSINKPLVVSADKFRNPDFHVIIKAAEGAKTAISGGERISDWKQLDNDIWEAKVNSAINPQELFIGDKRCTRARFPNTGFLRVKKVGEDRRTNFFFEKDEFPIPLNNKDVELVFLHDWSMSRIGIKEINLETNQLTAIDTIGTKTLDFFRLDGWEEHPRYFLENDQAFLDAEFEWYFDSESEKILLKLPSGQNPQDMEIFVPLSEGLVLLTGSKERPIKNIVFDGITFKHCVWNIPSQGYCGIQACHFDGRPDKHWNVVSAAIKTEWAENILFDNCIFKNMGGSGLWFSRGSKNCSVKNSVFFDIAGNGIMIGEGQDRKVNGKSWWQETPEDVAIGNSVEDCKVTQCGARFFGAVGIWCGLSAETNIKDNHVYDLPYTGISVGWMWSPVPTPCRENSVDGNHIHDVMNVLSDGGGIYMLGLQPGSKLVNNRIHDVRINAGRAESNGMFLDEGATDVLVANNLIYNIAKSPLRFHRATTNLVKENYLFCSPGNPPIRYNRTKEEDIQKVDNLVLTEGDKGYQQQLDDAIERFAD